MSKRSGFDGCLLTVMPLMILRCHAELLISVEIEISSRFLEAGTGEKNFNSERRIKVKAPER